VWFDDGPVFFKGFHASGVRLGSIETKGIGRESSVASSATAVAAEGGDGFVGGVPPAPLVTIAPPRLMGGSGCKGWLPSRDFVVAGDDLVSAGECQWYDYSAREPLYVRSLRGGRWRVLRWLATVSQAGGDGVYYNVEPVLAAEGDLVAVGVQFSSAKMEVSILDVRNGRTVARLDVPDGFMAFASRERLVLSFPVLGSPEDEDFPLSSGDNLYRLALYSTSGYHIAELGLSQEPPLVSGMHLVTDEEGTVSVRSVAGGAPTPVAGFDEAREQLALAFRWPALVVVEATRTPLRPSEVRCWGGEYGPAGPPFLGLFDLARPRPFAPAPAPVHVEPSPPLTNCGPPPP
jgi:hypothetical protein